MDGYVINGDGITFEGNGIGETIPRVGDEAAARANMTALTYAALGRASRLVEVATWARLSSQANTYRGGAAMQ
ncbi:hypothetical protein EGY25_00565 [Brevundimonas intermedia]|uniref:Uncharacterized protein n=1 Tax=Brevundimonas intermedia TaxID=74315 RepID=A0A4Y9S3Q0_9CAUL|nr:hypothetical protein [Brevundimonas intermedia]TFW15121.1 hypothetical protein EGY25_00565 [Brevundimonas intermedia]